METQKDILNIVYLGIFLFILGFSIFLIYYWHYKDSKIKMKFNFKKALFTICFYEYPAALHNIEIWEKLIEKRIYYIEKSKKEFVYLIQTHDFFNIEYLICKPVSSLTNISQEIQKAKNILKEQTFQNFEKIIYNKTLIFGKVTLEEVINIQKIVMELTKNEI